MKQTWKTGLVVLLAFAALVAVYVQKPSYSTLMAFDRVTQSKTIRCGYLPYEPFVIKDPNTGKLSGVTVDYLDKVAARQGYKIEWAGETTFDQVVPSLDGGRFDMFCVPATPTTDYERVVEFVGNLGGLPYYTYVSTKTDVKAEDLPTATFVIHDAFALTGITKEVYPNANFISLPQTASTAEFFDQLRYGKAQAGVNEPISAENYMKANPGVMRRVSDTPVIAMRMFLLAQKADTAMHAFIGNTFGIENPDNLAAMKEMLVKYNVPDRAVLLGDDCKAALSDKGWKICAP